MQNKNIKKLVKLLTFLLVVLYSPLTLIQAQQTNDLAVLHLQSKGKYNRVFSPHTNVKQLIDIYNNQQATIEFWAMHNTSGSSLISDINWNVTNFKSSNEAFSLDVTSNKISLQIGVQKIETNLLLGDQLFKNSWNHFVITLDKNTQELRVFINSEEKIFTKTPIFDIQDLYITSNPKTDLFLAEYRAWASLKTKEQIELQQYQSFYKNTQNSLTELKNNGLQVVYTNDVTTHLDNFGNKALITTSWKNLLYNYFPNDNLVEQAEFTSSYKNTGVATINTNISHPILNLDKIIVKASDGDGSDHHLLAGTNGIAIKWLHIKDADEYQVLRRNVRSGTLSSLIHTEQNVSNKQPSEEIVHVDKGILPNELYEYTIQAKKQGANTLTGKDVGFVLPNGKVSGTIATSSSVATKNAKVEAITAINPGSALHVEQNAKPIFIKNIEAFRKATSGATFEFWYKTPTLGDGENKILKIGNAELIVSKTKIAVKLGSTNYLEATRISDANWHHYAFTFGASGGKLFEDGIEMNNGSTSNLFALNLNGTNAFCLSATTNTSYYIDEVRFWNIAKTPVQIQEYANHIIGGNEPNLFAYYRFDFNDTHKAYNFSSSRKGQYTAESEGALKRLSANEQPKITYATYTNEVGNYEFTTLSTGIQGVTNNDTKLEFTIRPSKPRFEFLPKTKLAGVPRKLNGAEVTAVNFTDVSSLPVTGVISYKVGNDTFPTIQGTSLLVDGTVIKSIEDAKVTTDVKGVYAVKVAPGKHTITPNPKPNLTDEDRLNEGSVQFDGLTGYASSSQSITNNGNSFTWSGFIRPHVQLNDADKVSPTQTILQWGELSVKLINNTTLKVYASTQEKLSETISGNQAGQFAFWAISFDATNSTLNLYLNNAKKTTAQSSLNINDFVTLGKEVVFGKNTNFSKANLDVLEFRNSALTQTHIGLLKDGKLISGDHNHLKLSYSFNQKHGTKAINLVASNENNNYLQFSGGCRFDNTNNKLYLREVEFSYKATNTSYNPTGSSYEVVVEEPLQNVHFENTTRRSFIGNIVVPCNNSVGNWTGKIVRTDIEHPKFEKTISVANFNNNNTVFTIQDLLPGRYRVELTNVTSNRTLQTPILDLRRQNVVYDFPYRNPLEIEIEMYKLSDLSAVSVNPNDAEKYVGDKIDSSCDGKYIFKSHEGFKMSVSVFERYGENKCLVKDAEVKLGGDAILSSNDLVINASADIKNFYTKVSIPNYLGDYTRSFLISANHNGRTASITKKAIITGANQSNSDFTLVEPQVGYVLHDPPGDNSYATLAKGATYTSTFSSDKGTNITTDNSIGLKAHLKAKLITGTVTGIGAAAIVASGTYIYNINSENKVLIGAEFQYVKNSGNETTVVLDKEISTPSDPTYVGEDADVFIGLSRVISFGTGKVLKMNGCTPVIENSNKVAKPTNLIPFAYTKQSIIDVVIPNLYRLAIAKYDKNNGITNPKGRDHLDLEKTLNELLAKSPSDKNDKEIVRHLHEISTWKRIINDNHQKLKADSFNQAPDFSSTTEKLTNGNDPSQTGVGLNPSILDKRIAFDALTQISYTLSRGKIENTGSTFGGGAYTGFNYSVDKTFFGLGLTLSGETKVHGFRNNTTTNSNGNNRIDSFTLNDDDAGDHFDVSIRRDPQYDTPMFLTNAGRSSCPFESGTVPREGVELIVDKVIGYGTGDESILYNLTLRNTQIAKDATRKTYIVGMAGASNPLGAVVNLNESPIFEPTTSSKFVFDLDPNSPTGVKQEIKAQLRIARGTDAPSVISYENIKIQMYSECEQTGDRYRSYGVDEYNEVGVKPYAEILVTAHFTGACIETITADAPQNDWVVNGSDKKKLDFKFRIPELKDKPATDDFSVDLEYTIQGNNTPKILKKLDLATLKANLNATTDYVEYSADVSGLTDGEYSFRIVPVCGDGGSDNPNNRKNPTPFVKGKISRSAPKLVLTTPDDGGIFTSGTISAKFSAPINPATVNLNSLAMRGILGGIPKPLTSVKLDHINDLITIPHNNKFNLEDKFTIEMWVNPAKYPVTGSVPILKKGNNYHVSLTSGGKIDIGGIQSTTSLQPFTWSHVAVACDKTNETAIIYINGNPVGSGKISSVLSTNEDAITIAPLTSGDAFVGSLDEIRLWQSVRSPLQIVSNMKNQLLGNEDTLEAYFVFNNNTLAKQGINGDPDEAIQDFTGNAKGTTATSITFITNEEAAPLDQTKTVEDVQFTTTMSENNTIINFNMKIEDLEFVEGARLTVFVKDKKLEDPLGNRVDKTSWSFIIDRSKLKWSHNNIAVSQNQGNSTLINYVDLINKDGGVDVAYTFENLPVWFGVKSGANPAKDAVNIIKATETNSNLEFEVKSFLNPGVHTANIYIKTSNKDTGKKLGVESFRVEVTVNCPEPAVSKDFTTKYPFNMNMKGNIFINNQKSLDINDVVKAYVGNELRGYAKADANGLVDLTVWGNTGETAALTFKVWDASACTEYEGIIENYSLSTNTQIGTSFAPTKFTVGSKVTQRIPIVIGYQELSFNLRDNANVSTLSLSAIKKLPVNSQIVDILDPTKSATLGSNGLFTGTLTVLDINKAYLVNCAASHDQISYLEVSGTPVDIDTNITIKGSKIANAIPFYPNDLQRTGYALRSFTATNASEGDRIERRGLFAEYSATEGWRGSLTHLTPGFGYIFKATKDGAINYSGIIKTAAARLMSKNKNIVLSDLSSTLEETPSATELGLDFNANAFASFMYINGIINDAKLDSDKAYTILAFVNDELRGISKSEFINNQFHYYLGIGGDISKDVQFKLYDGTHLYDIENNEIFTPNKVLGDLSYPYSFRLKVDKANELVNSTLFLSQNIPNPMSNNTKIQFNLPEDSYVQINIYNMVGQNLGVLTSGKFDKGQHSFNWDGTLKGEKLSNGTYIYDLQYKGKRLYRKLIMVK